MVFTIREALRFLLNDGWHLVVRRGSYVQFRHPVKPGTVTVAGRESDSLSPKAWASIREQSGLK
jgi:predicted RNA binding protein YcfA (HicA-like mRNA interferase family)